MNIIYYKDLTSIRIKKNKQIEKQSNLDHGYLGIM